MAEVRKKYKVHALSDAQVRQRLERAPRLLKWIGGSKWKYVVTLDEAWVYLTHVNGQRQLYYKFRGKSTPESWTKFWRQKHPKGVMFVAGISYRGQTKLRFVPPGAKINSDFYINNVLKPLIAEDIPRLHPGQEHKVIIHHDNAPSHQSKKTQAFLKTCGKKFIPKEDWLRNSPDVAPMDYGVNGDFKRRLWRHKVHTVTGLKRVMTTEWKKTSIPFIRKTLASWPGRVKMIEENKGYHIEHKRKKEKNVSSEKNLK
jgi:inhibitor of nuclear factor kappa-B kinase subunit alpha